MELSVATTTYNSENTIELFLVKMIEIIEKCDIKEFEIIVVDDGSVDKSCDKLEAFKAIDPRVQVYELSRNFGHHIALFEAVLKTKGKWVYMTDSDLEESPNSLELFLNARIENPNVEIFESKIERNEKSKRNRALGHLFWLFIFLASGRNISRNLGTTRFFSARVRDTLTNFQEREIFLPSIFAYCGYKRSNVILYKTFRGKSNYTLRKKVQLTLLAITNQSNLLVAKIVVTSLLVNILSFCLVLIVVINWTLENISLPGWTSLFILLTTSLIFQVALQNVILFLLSKVLEETRRRPRAILK